MNTDKPTLSGLILKSVVLHSVTYFLAAGDHVLHSDDLPDLGPSG
jgi:hypothetical protein